MIKKESRNSMRKVRHERIRKTIMGTCATPRLCVFRSNTGIYAQIIDDETRTTLVSASSLYLYGIHSYNRTSPARPIFSRPSFLTAIFTA